MQRAAKEPAWNCGMAANIRPDQARRTSCPIHAAAMTASGVTDLKA
jgi:hypothetical protein